MTKRCLLPVAICFLFGLLFSIKNQYWTIAPFLILEVYIFLRLNKYNMRAQGYMLIGLLLVTFIFSSFYGYGTKQKREVYLSTIKTGDEILIQGRLFKKEAKNKSYNLYLDKGLVLLNDESIACNEILVVSDSIDYILGNTLVVKGIYKEFETARNEGGYDEKEVCFNKGINIKIDPVISIEEYGKDSSFREGLYLLKEKMKKTMSLYLKEDDAGVLSSIVLGDKSDLSVEDKESYSSAGLSHILAVSGLHISLLCMGLYNLLRKIKVRQIPAVMVSVMFSIVYCLFTGASVSTTRAVGMFILSMLALVLGEAYDMISALCLLCIVILLDNPMSLFSAGFLLSFSAVIGIAITGKILTRFYERLSVRRDFLRKRKRELNKKKIPKVFEKLRRYFDDFEKMLLINVSIIITTLPFVAWFYYEVPTLSLIVNILVIPLMGILLGLGFFGSLLGCLNYVFGLILVPCGLITEFYRMVANSVNNIDFSQWIIGRPSFLSMTLYFAILIISLNCLNKISKSIEMDGDENGEELGADLKRYNRFNLFFFAGVGLLVLFLIAQIILLNNRRPCLKMLDVGQGDGIYISTGEVDVFIDGGSSSIKEVGKYRIAPFLKCVGAGSIEYWIISHPDDDHISGLIELLEERYIIKNVIVSNYIARNENFDTIRQLCDRNSINLIYFSPGDMLDFGNEKMTCLYPDSHIENENDSSLVLFYETDNMDVLFTGDMGTDPEKELMNSWQWPSDNKTHILKVAHHGSKNSSNDSFLSMCDPDIALISSGQHNSYGHPHKETLEKLETLGCIIRRTDIEGEIIIE